MPVIVTSPTLTPVTSPELETVAISVLEEVNATLWFVAVVGVKLAASCIDCPTRSVGVSRRPVARTLTLRTVTLHTELVKFVEIWHVPLLTATTCPLWFTVAMLGFEDVHVVAGIARGGDATTVNWRGDVLVNVIELGVRV